MKKIKIILIPFLINFFVRLLSLTLRFKIVTDNQNFVMPPARAHQRGCLYAFWHGDLLLNTYAFRKTDVYGIVSRSRDGEMLVRLLKSWGYRNFIRGSSSRGWASLFKESVSALKRGGQIGIAPDGPRGPYHKVNPGIIKMAQTTGCDIVPLGFGYSNKRHLKSWDKFTLPMPFSKIVFLIGLAFQVPADADKATLKALSDKLEADLNRMSGRAQAMVGG